MMRDGNPTTNWPVVILAGGCMASLMGGSLGLAAAIGIPDALVRWVLFAMVLPVFVLIPLWLSLEIQAGHRALETGVQPWPLFSKRKNRAHRLVGLALACIFIAFILRTFVAAPYRVEIDAAAPEFPYGSQFLVWRLTRHFAPGDLIAYWHDGLANMGRVVRNKNGVLSVNQNGNPDVAVPREAVIGKVISVYWRASNILESAPGNAASIPNTHSASGGAPQLMQEGQQLWQAGKLAEAAVKFNQAVALAPEDANAWNELGWATFNSGKPEEARKAFQQAVSLDPSQPGALNGLGQLYLAQRNYDQAEAYLLKAAPQAPAAWYGLTRLYLLEGKFEQAARWAQDLIDAGQADDLVRQMLRAAQARQLSEGLRFRIEPPLPNPGEKVAPNAASSESGSPALSELPPVPVETQPVSGSRDVASGETEIRVRFSKEMTDDSWSWSTAWENSTPEFIGPPHFESDGRTCVAKAKLEPGRMYAFWLNSDRFHGFKDRDGHPAVPYLLIFQTQQK
jgi:tetratricopeptide (TPR) repeat protein